MSRLVSHDDIRIASDSGLSPAAEQAANRIADALVGNAMDRLSNEFVFATQDNDNAAWKRLKKLVLPAMERAVKHHMRDREASS